ncbi:MAG: hypothetical protein LH629_02795 [Ignavibacteria bacterium]|nr:hypothetical protein [Ignavibacteria bacterium]
MNYLKNFLRWLSMLMISIILLSCGKSSDKKTNTEVTGIDSKNTAKVDSISDKINMKNPEITLDKLPASVKLFVEKNFSGYHILTAIPDPLCQGGDAMDVSIEKPGLPKLSLIFKTDGSFVQLEEDVPLNSAPKNVIKSLNSKFPDCIPGS